MQVAFFDWSPPIFSMSRSNVKRSAIFLSDRDCKGIWTENFGALQSKNTPFDTFKNRPWKNKWRFLTPKKKQKRTKKEPGESSYSKTGTEEKTGEGFWLKSGNQTQSEKLGTALGLSLMTRGTSSGKIF